MTWPLEFNNQVEIRLLGLGNEKSARGILVQAMHDARSFGATLHGQTGAVGKKSVDKRIVLMPGPRMAMLLT